MVAQSLEREDSHLTVHTETSAAAGIERLDDTQINCVVSDYEMPGKNGVEFLNAVREDHPDLPFVLFTGNGSEEIASDAISAGVTDYLQKNGGTGQYTHLSHRITNAVAQYRSQQEVQTSQERLSLFFEQSPLGAIEWTDEFEIERINDTAEDILGYEADELTGSSWNRLVPEPQQDSVAEVFSDPLNESTAYNTEQETVTRDGDRIICEWHHRIVRDELGDVVTMFSKFQDVTDRVERKRKLAKERSFTEQALDTLDHVFYVIDSDGTLKRWNERLGEITGHSDIELDGLDALELFPEDEQKSVADAIQTAIDRGSTTLETDLLGEDGNRIPFIFIGKRLTDPQGNFLGMVGIGRDLSERKERETELTFIRDLLEKTEHVADVGGWEIDTETSEVFWTDHLFEMLGVDSEGAPPLEEALDVYIEEDRPRVANAVEEAIAVGEPFDVEARFQRPDGEIRWFQIQGEQVTDDGEVVKLRGAVQDITQHKERERQLRESEQRYRTLAESFPNGIVTLFDEELRYTLASGDAFEYLPVASEDVKGFTPREVWGDAVGDKLESAFEAVLDGQERSVEVEYSGRYWVIHAVPITDESGNVLSGMTIAQDITERKNREEETAAREQALRSAYEIITDGDRTVAEQIDSLLAVGREHLGTDYSTFSHIHDDRYEFECVRVGPDIDLEAGATTDLTELPICEQVFQTGEPLVISDVSDEASELVDPEWGIASYLGAPVVVNGTTYGTFCFYDVEPRYEAFSTWEQTFVELLSDWVGSELTQLQTTEQLQRQNEQLGEFANVVSHDLQNPLNVAEGQLELAQEKCDSKHLKAIEKAHTRMGTLIGDLLTLARNGHEMTDHTLVDLGTLIDDCWKTVETADSDLVVDIDRTILADRSRLMQLFENLVRNAVEHGGDDVTVTVGELETGFYIEDDGFGIPQAERDEVFEPGFSTNPDGTGFGLRIAKQVAEAHNWEMQLSESENGGVRFEITGGEFAGK